MHNVGDLIKETVVGAKYVIATYRMQGTHPTFGHVFFATYMDKTCKCEVQDEGYALQFHDTIVKHVSST